MDGEIIHRDPGFGIRPWQMGETGSARRRPNDSCPGEGGVEEEEEEERHIFQINFINKS